MKLTKPENRDPIHTTLEHPNDPTRPESSPFPSALLLYFRLSSVQSRLPLLHQSFQETVAHPRPSWPAVLAPTVPNRSHWPPV